MEKISRNKYRHIIPNYFNLTPKEKMHEINNYKSLKKYGSILKIQRLKKEFDPNNKKKAQDVPLTYQRDIKWICSICRHKWSSAPIYRYDLYITKKVRDCPPCSLLKQGKTMKKTLLKKNKSLLEKFPNLCDEWDYKKNKVDPSEITSGSDEEYWWICVRHGSYLRSPYKRTKHKAGCKICFKRTFSRPEVRLFCEIKSLFPNVFWNSRIQKRQIDIFLKDFNLGFEIDGHYHAKKFTLDQRKNQFFKKKGIKIIRLRYPLLKSKISKDDFFITNRGIELDHIKKCLLLLKKFRKIDNKNLRKINKYLKRTNFINNKEYQDTLKLLPNIPKQLNLKFNYPKLCEDWDYKKNKPERPEFFHSVSNQKVYWLCNKKPSEQPKIIRYLTITKKLLNKHPGFKMAISDRIDGHGCYSCGTINRVISNQAKSIRINGSLKDYPEIFNLIKSKKIKNDIKEILHQIPTGSKITFDWYCKKHKHTWNSHIARIILQKHGCRYCGYENATAKRKLKK